MENGEVAITKSGRPLIITICCIFSFIFNGILIIGLTTILFFPGYLTRSFGQYLPEINLQLTTSYLILVSGILLFGVTFTGAIYIWKLRRLGLYLYLPAKLSFLIFLIFTSNYSVYNIGISVFLIVVFLLYRKRYE